MVSILVVSLFMFVAISSVGKKGLGKAASGVVAEAISTTTPNKSAPIRIFCFGDSLTAGTSPPGFETFPYAPFLEDALHQGKLPTAVVRHLGLPGWTASQLLEDANGERGLRTMIKRIQDPSLSLVIILAGTNDLGHHRSPSDIVTDLIQLHTLCHKEGIAHTIALAVPSSAFQTKFPEYAEKARKINRGLRKYCEEESNEKATYVSFPFGWEPNDERWSRDGLHFSKQGYQVLAESLAPVVESILVADDLNR